MKQGLGVLVAALAASSISAQTIRPVANAAVVTARVRSELPAHTEELSGTALRGTGAVAFGRFHLLASYLQGSVQPDGGAGQSRDLAEGTVLLGAVPFKWLTLETGPYARAYSTPGATTQRWVFWELRARAAGAFIGSAVHGYAELWRALTADVNVPEPFDHAEGGEAGMIVRLARSPLEGRLAYRIDHVVLGGGSRTQTVDGVIVGIGVAWR